MNTKKSNQLNWRNKRTVETADPNAKVVLSDDTFVDFSELSTDPEVEKIEEEVEQLSETVTAQGEQLDNVEDAVTVIEGKIPAEASSQNQLADKDFVNESVATASAAFKGTYNSLQELEQVEADANDYGFVIVEDQYGNTRYDRYKYTEGDGWLFEYSINSVQFSSSQWSAINSGIDDSKVSKLNALPTKVELDASIDAKANKSEMSVSTNADKTTITLKTGTSAEVINAHQDISGKVNGSDFEDTEQVVANALVDLDERMNGLATIASTGDYDDLVNKPTIPTVPTNVSAFTNDAGYLTQHQSLANYVQFNDLASVATSGDYDDLSNKPTLFSGDYNDLTNKPTIPTVPTNVSAFTNDAGYLTQHQDISGKVDVADFEEAEEVTAEALVDLDTRVTALEQAIEALTNNA